MPSSPAIAAVLEANGIDSEDGQIILRREITAGGKGRVFINNQPATVTVLKQLAPHLAVIHAQNAAVLAFDAGSRLALLDSFAGCDDSTVAAAFESWNEVRHRIADLERDEHDRLRLLDLWTYQRKEIADARLQPDEDAKLEAEKRVLANSERVRTAAMAAYDALYEGNASAAASIRAATRQIEELLRFDEQFRDAVPELESARITIEDIGQRLRDYAEDIEASPERLAEVEDRLAAARSAEAQVRPEAGRRDRAGRRTRAQAERDGEQGRGAAQVASRAGGSGRAISAKRRERCRGSATRRRASWRSWSRARSTNWR